MKQILVMGIVIALSLSVAGLGFSAEQVTLAMKHGDAKICENINCCGAQAKAKETVSETKNSTTLRGEISLSFWEALMRNGVGYPIDR